MSGIGQRWRISLQPQTCCSTSLHAHAYAQIRTQNSVVNFYRSAHAFPHHLCPATLLPSFWVCTWPQDMVAPSCWFKAEEDQATALWATPASQGCLEALGHPSSLNLPALDQPSQRLGPRSSGVATLLKSYFDGSVPWCWCKRFFENPFRRIIDSQGSLLIDCHCITQPTLGPKMIGGV